MAQKSAGAKKGAAASSQKRISAVKRRKPQYETVAKASLREVRIAPRKVRYVLDLVKGKQLGPALDILAFKPNKGARLVHKLLKSAVANATERDGSIDVDTLWVSGGWVDMGKTLRRFMPRAQGRATPIRKRASHITVELGVSPRT
ncbi:MAG: 50S ribosomal protein L22 [Bdellovibrionales bacterium]|nr:50S ribosomal protein L22 [Bdellovibrionales bacterium]